MMGPPMAPARPSSGDGALAIASGAPPARLGPGAATALVVASMIGTGVFTTTGLLVEALGSPLAVLAAWGAGGALAATGALSYAELVAALPRNGGEYQLLSRIYHPAVGFAAGVVSFVVGFAAPLAASALAFGRYASAALGWVHPAPLAMGVVVVFAVAHGVDVGWGARVQGALTSVLVLVILLATAVGLGLGDPARVLDAAASPALPAVLSPAFAVALVLVSFAYSGWNGASYVAGEVRAPSRTVPRSLVVGTALVTGVYLALNVAFLSAAPASDLAGVVEVAHVAAARLAGAGAARFVSAVVAVTLASSVGAMLLAGPRVAAEMGRDYPALAVLSRRTARGAPAAAVAAQAALALAMIATASFGALLAYIGFTLSACAGLTVLGVLVLRAREPRLVRPVLAWGYPVTPLLFVALSTWMISRALVDRPASSLAGAATVVISLLLYAVAARSRRRAPDPAPE